MSTYSESLTHKFRTYLNREGVLRDINGQAYFLVSEWFEDLLDDHETLADLNYNDVQSWAGSSFPYPDEERIMVLLAWEYGLNTEDYDSPFTFDSPSDWGESTWFFLRYLLADWALSDED